MTSISLKEAVFNRRMLICCFTGFSSGLPYYVVLQLLQIWLRDVGVSLSEIALFSLVTIPYTLKFIWAPAMDFYVPPFLGRRRGWMLITQIMTLIFIGLLGVYDPTVSLINIAVVVLLLSFFSASQDIVLDAYRRELLPDVELGLGNTIHVQAFRISGLIPGSLALILADHMQWGDVFWVVAAFMLFGIALTFFISEPATAEGAPLSLTEALVEPFHEFFQRRGIKSALLILAFMFLYKVGDSMATALSSAFYLDLGFSKTQIGIVAKNAALWPVIIGGLLGGLLMLRIGINRGLWLFGVVQLVSILGFAILALAGAKLWLLVVVIGFEYLGVGLGAAAFVAFIARETNKRYAATQLALLSAITLLPRTFANATTGFIVDSTGWFSFFVLCAVIALPGMLLLIWVAPWNASLEPE